VVQADQGLPVSSSFISQRSRKPVSAPSTKARRSATRNATIAARRQLKICEWGNTPFPTSLAMKFLTEYPERAVSLERLAADESDPTFKEQLLGQAAAYRKLAAKRAEEYGLPPPSLPESST
jgi:hypothetical protein